MVDTQKLFLSWLAGFIDGEGTISITRKNPQTMNRTYHKTYRAYLSIANTSGEIMNLIQENLSSMAGRSIGTLGEYGGKNPKHKRYYLFSVNKMLDLVWVLRTVQPYLILKKSQAEMVISFLSSREEKLGKKHFGSDITANEIKIFDNIRILNKRGASCQQN